MSGEVTVGLDVIAATTTGSNLLGVGIGQMAVGAGSQTMSTSNTSLVNEFDRNQIDSIDLSTSAQSTFISNWSPLEISGLVLKEHGFTTEGSKFVAINTLTGSVVFDGEQELQIQQSLKFFI